MNLSLFQATLITSLLLLLLGICFVLNRPLFRAACITFLRSSTAAYLTMGSAGAWFLWKVMNLGPADFGDYKHYMLVIFGAALLLSFKYLPDFLSVRGLCSLWLLLAVDLLAPGYGLENKSLYLPIIIYVFITLAIWVGVSPFRLRDFFTFIHRSAIRSRILGLCLSVYGVILLVTAFTH